MIVANLVMTFTVPTISWQGHIGGLFTGALIAAVFVYAPRERRNLVQGGVCAAVAGGVRGLVYWRTSELIDQYGALISR